MIRNTGKFKVNALVLKLDFKRKKTKGGKLKDRFVGPYKILSCLPHEVYKLQDSKGITIRATGSHLKIFHPDPTASISSSCKTMSVDDRPSEKDSLRNQSVHEDPKSSPPKSGISVDDPPSEVDESSHSVHKDLKGAPPKNGISVDDPQHPKKTNQVTLFMRIQRALLQNLASLWMTHHQKLMNQVIPFIRI